MQLIYYTNKVSVFTKQLDNDRMTITLMYSDGHMVSENVIIPADYRVGLILRDMIKLTNKDDVGVVINLETATIESYDAHKIDAIADIENAPKKYSRRS